MKKLLFVLVLITSMLSSAQLIDKYEITPEGWTNGFMVSECEGKTAEELYNNTLMYLNKVYASPENITKDEKNLFIRVTIYHSDIYKVQSGTYASMRVTYMFDFKDGKIKIELSSIEIPTTHGYDFSIKGGGLSYSFYNKKGKERKSFTDDREYFETYINASINEFFQKACSSDIKKDEW